MGSRTDQAREQVGASRDALAGEIAAMERSIRDAADLPAKARRDPLKVAALMGGTAFLALGGPRRIARRFLTVLRGGRPPAPRSLLPEEVERTVEGLGRDAPALKASLERQFARFLEEHRQDRRRADLASTLLRSFDTVAGTLSKRAAGELAERLFGPGRLFGRRPGSSGGVASRPGTGGPGRD